MGKAVSNERVTQAIPDEVWVLTRAHVGEQLENEVGGFLIGFLGEDGLTVTHAVPAREAVGSAAQLTFPPEAWTAVLSTIEERDQGERLVGWYHSHPGHGIFLSAYDEFIQSQFFPEEGQIAIVIDPQTGEEGVFVTRNGKTQDVFKRSGTKAKGQTKAQQAAKRDRRSLFFRAGSVVILIAAFASFGLIRSGYNSGFADGEAAGDAAGFARGDTAGYDRGFSEGDAAGYERGFGEGDAAGFARGDAAGYTRGYALGQTTGYASGFSVGRRDGVDATTELYGPFVPTAVSGQKAVRLTIEYATQVAADAAKANLALTQAAGTTTAVTSIDGRWFLVIDVVESGFTAAPITDLANCVAQPESCTPAASPLVPTSTEEE
jgi:proteasome lid subunit RPN8/RPN11